MKAAEWKKIVRPLMSPPESWAYRGRMCYRLPVEWTLAGIHGEPSGLSKDVYIWRLLMPLFVPSDVIDLSWSDRVGGGARTYGVDNIERFRAALEEAQRTLAEDLRLKYIAQMRVPGNSRALEASAYAHLLLGEVTPARELLRELASQPQSSTYWINEIYERARRVSMLIDDSGLDGAVGQLGKWRDETITSLGIHRS